MIGGLVPVLDAKPESGGQSLCDMGEALRTNRGFSSFLLCYNRSSASVNITRAPTPLPLNIFFGQSRAHVNSTPTPTTTRHQGRVNSTQLKARAKRARRASKQINTNALRRQRLFLFQSNLSGSDSSLKCVHVRNVYTLTPLVV